ncbi:Phophatidylserine decarboxylase-domain-containing protein [Fomitopsis serialis]|uniref:Phophatidylserine decarboxylase-domain-containing protein n=1 Tax=Fomitopsis serialis TaxID=139415 RepID=UPI002007C0B9|nr:Phophatidylserine decarboxylase-domain-containing protein [Neoantrodia serialis]KAH9933788.1 Phophatidylserine decarboxylase-domain-containing protein [Neoantrodia serialis]
MTAEYSNNPQSVYSTRSVGGDHFVSKTWLQELVRYVAEHPKELHSALKGFRNLIESETRLCFLAQSMFEQIPAKAPYADDPAGYKQIATTNICCSGFAFFLDPAVNEQLKKVLDAWGDFLRSEESARQALGDDAKGWFNAKAKADLTAAANGAAGTTYDFAEIFGEGIRPVASPEDDDVIANACESEPYKFAGGTVYQAFLSALSYHRWHAPVSGRCVKAYVQPGAYYPSRSSTRRDGRRQEHLAGYVTAVATRAIVFIEADNPAIGLVAFLGVGLAEEGQWVRKGDQLGMFHFGGSTHCVIFRRETDVHGFPEPGRETNVPVRGQLAVVRSRCA